MRNETDNEKPGICKGCGHDTRKQGKGYGGRDTGGFCNDCHNANYHKWLLAKKKHNGTEKEKGIEYWKERGIKVGDKVGITALSWTGMGGEFVVGIAKSGSNGAYVSSKYHPGKLSPNGWKKIQIGEK